ncbi:Uncharacterized conserved protein, DUF433 family [Duganella sp. CF402]|uniref:DUF433 domain-containing protein n=1 Tax=unclassified Duganella TaxID=2636909 RepID=UPI0008BFD694|nr:MULTISPECIES: DUF433 domain-containing protein [unclassified Duganella]RZT05654.1 uncharacterized protein (DUF433 family) [Duganella sp. BK701]SEM95861.1 Uncharacterized conserved protein, DUF433 family [Duganella sp. CF402]
MAKKKPTSFPATHELGELLLKAAAEMEAQKGWDQHGERPSEVARAFVDLLFETEGQPMPGNFAEATDKKSYHSDPEIMDGTPVFCGSRVPISCLFDYLGAGESLDVFLDQYPTVSKEAAISLLNAAKQLLEEDAYFAAEFGR